MTPRPGIVRQDGRLEVRADAYALVVGRPDRPYARLTDADGRIWADLALLGNASTLDGPDDWWSIDEPAVSAGAEGVTLTCAARPARWTSARLVLEAFADHLRIALEVDGDGRLTDVELLAGSMTARPRMGTGRFESGRRFRSIVAGAPDDPARLVSPAGEVSVVGVTGGSPPGRGRWFFTPGALAFAASPAVTLDPRRIPDGPWLAFGLDVGGIDSDRANLTAFEYVPGDGSFGFRLRYEGHTRVAGTWRSPALLLVPGATDPYTAVAATIARRRAAPAAARPDVPAWWLEPMFCGWGAQTEAAAAEGVTPAALARQDRYDGWLAALGAHGIVPGTVVIDDKWQRTYGRNEPDETKWPDLADWIADRHGRGQRVLVWWKAWDAEGLPPDWCVRNAGGLPVAGDPTNPEYEAALRESIRSILAPPPAGLGADGLKIDFTGQTPSGASLTTHAEDGGGTGPWGMALLHGLLEIVAEAAREVRPDALLINHVPEPAFRDVTSMIRLNDALRLDDPEPLVPVVAQLRHRAALARAADPDVPIDSDDWAMPSRAEWLAWQRAKIELGVPALYHVDRVAGEPITDDDLAVVAETWARYRERLGLAPAGAAR